MSDDNDALLDAVTALVPAVMNTLEAFNHVGRHLHPETAGSMVEAVQSLAAPLDEGRARFEAADWPEHLQDFRDRILAASDDAAGAIEAFVTGARHPNGMLEMFKSLRRATGAVEQLYPIATALPPVSRFFLEPAARADDALAAARFEAMQDAAGRDTPVGVLQIDHERHQRGGFCVYVPEFYDAQRSWPLIVALHGGSGHGRDFLWTWLREARTRGAIVIAPTSVDRTWSLMGGEDVDIQPLFHAVARVCETWNVDPGHRLLTGMSDGGTYTLLAGLAEGSPFTHLAPISGVLHPHNMINGNLERARDVPIYLVHGVLDWMFPVDSARMARDTLTAAGAALVYREIEDLSHTYPRDENGAIIEWFDARLGLGDAHA